MAFLAGANYLVHAFGFTLIDWNKFLAGACAGAGPGLADCQAARLQAASLFELILGMAVLLLLSVALVAFLVVRDGCWLLRFGKGRTALTGTAAAVFTLFPAVIGHTLWSYLTAGEAAFAGTRATGLPGLAVLGMLTLLLAAILMLAVSYVLEPFVMKAAMKGTAYRR